MDSVVAVFSPRSDTRNDSFKRVFKRGPKPATTSRFGISEDDCT
jgi:hypothetical protein